MATDEGSGSTQDTTESSLEDLFAANEDGEDEAEKEAGENAGEQDEEGNTDRIGDGMTSDDTESILGDGIGTDQESSTGASRTGMGPATPSERTDAEILTDTPGSDVDTSGNGSGTTSEAPTRPDDAVGKADTESGSAQASNRLTTGITMLDRELEGGIPPGRMLSLVAPPETQSELLVKEMAISRPSVYISTFRPEWEVREGLRDHLQKSQDEALLDNELQVSYVRPEDLLAEPMAFIGDLPKGSNLIIDSINEFEIEDRTQYVEFLNTAKEALWDTGSVGLFYGIEEPRAPQARSLTLKRSDIVWQLDRSVRANEIQTTLVISKFRGGKALTEPVKLVLTDEVQVDLSRDIG